jgi:hypothetical protein
VHICGFEGSQKKKQIFPYTVLNDWFLGAIAKLRKANISFLISVRLSFCMTAWNNSAPIGRIVKKFDIPGFFETLSRKLNFRYNVRRITGNMHEDLCTLIIISRWILLKMRNISDKYCRQNQNTYFVFKNDFQKFVPVWDNVKKYVRARQVTDDKIIWRMSFACWITKATNTHSEYVILIAFPRQRWLRERAAMLPFIRTLSLSL